MLVQKGTSARNAKTPSTSISVNEYRPGKTKPCKNEQQIHLTNNRKE